MSRPLHLYGIIDCVLAPLPMMNMNTRCICPFSSSALELSLMTGSLANGGPHLRERSRHPPCFRDQLSRVTLQRLNEGDFHSLVQIVTARWLTHSRSKVVPRSARQMRTRRPDSPRRLQIRLAGGTSPMRPLHYPSGGGGDRGKPDRCELS